LEAIFGYLCFMIFYKWGVDYHAEDLYNQQIANTPNATLMEGTQNAPVVLNELIFMFLPGGQPNRLYDGQSTVQTAMVIIAGLSLPWMLIKPCVESALWKRSHPVVITPEASDKDNHDDHYHEQTSSASLDEDNPKKVDVAAAPKAKPPPPPVSHGSADVSGVHGGEEEFQFGESCIHNLLETIEFVLGSVSHTASYLRLWALSLAHSELATVFWEKVMFQVLDITMDLNFVIVGLISFAGFAVWFAITLMVMMFMELLSALLHALRLHWVEFQSKFYKGDGTPFKPFSLRKIHTTHYVMKLATKAT